jgi:photosystem II stability/assembly factor-like uncharacterized protein
MKRCIPYLFLLLSFISFAQAQTIPVPTTGQARLDGVQQRKRLTESSVVHHLPFTNIGPTIFSGRVVDVDVNPANPLEMYVAYASGGLWYSNNNGTSFKPVFDQEAVLTIGDIAVNWVANIIWVGTGENNSSRSSYSGVGMYKSTDKGKTWQYKGLAESHHISRIILHPTNPNLVHVACLGALYSASEHRGVYITSDGGNTWQRTLFANQNAGASDLVMDPTNPNVLYAATWERTRRAWNLTESGGGSGIYKSRDSGRTWHLLTTPGAGFPTGEGAGRIGLDIAKSKGGIILYAVIDNQDERPAEEKKEDKEVVTKNELRTMSKTDFLALDKKRVTAFLRENGFPEKYDYDTVRTMIEKDAITPITLVEYLEDANTMLFDTEVIGAEVYKSMDGGASWTRTHSEYLDNMFYTYGYYFGQIRVAANNPQKLYILGVPFLMSTDGGATWKDIDGPNVHGDHHALWVNPRKDGHLVLGNDGGLNISYDDGATWIKCNQPAVGQFYSVNVDMAEPYNVYGGLQDNGVWMGPSNYTANTYWHSSGQYPYKFIYGGDGMQVAIDTRDNNTVYTGSQFGNYSRLHLTGDDNGKYITPEHELGERPLRWNWETPIHLSVHNQDILYMGANRMFRSFDQGNHFTPISGDLTKGGREGNVAYGTIVSLHESPLTFGHLYAGTDDGYIHVTQDGGSNWKRISDPLPQNLWVSSVQASAHAKARVYASLNGYRWDHFDSYLYMSENNGDTWTRICTDLPPEAVNVVKEDPVHQDILYIGTDAGLYVSLDRGKTTMRFGNLPSVAVHDLVVHPRDREIVIGTHGRSFYKANVEHLQQLPGQLQEDLACFDSSIKTRARSNWGTRGAAWTKFNEPSITFPVYASAAGKSTLEIWSGELNVFETTLDLHKGLSYYDYNLQIDEPKVAMLLSKLEEKVARKQDEDVETIEINKRENGKYYLPVGTYTARVKKDGSTCEFKIEVVEK